MQTADPASARLVVELGAGTGGVTRSLLREMDANAQLLAIERNADFVKKLKQIQDSRLDIVHGCASSLGEEMKRRGLPSADAVISGIPFSTLSGAIAAATIHAIYGALCPGGRFVAYQFRSRVADYARPVMGAPQVEHVMRNVPPLRVFVWHKQDHAQRKQGPG